MKAPSPGSSLIHFSRARSFAFRGSSTAQALEGDGELPERYALRWFATHSLQEPGKRLFQVKWSTGSFQTGSRIQPRPKTHTQRQAERIQSGTHSGQLLVERYRRLEVRQNSRHAKPKQRQAITLATQEPDFQSSFQYSHPKCHQGRNRKKTAHFPLLRRLTFELSRPRRWAVAGRGRRMDLLPWSGQTLPAGEGRLERGVRHHRRSMPLTSAGKATPRSATSRRTCCTALEHSAKCPAPGIGLFQPAVRIIGAMNPSATPATEATTGARSRTLPVRLYA